MHSEIRIWWVGYRQSSRVHVQEPNWYKREWEICTIVRSLFTFYFFLFFLFSPWHIASNCMPLLPRLSLFSQVTAFSALVTVSYLTGIRVVHADANHSPHAQVKDLSHSPWNVLRFAQPPTRWWEVVDEHSSVSIATDHFQFGIWNILSPKNVNAGVKKNGLVPLYFACENLQRRSLSSPLPCPSEMK